jgi:glycosyltransferase involved in cell wall biosynthesis
MERSGVPVVLSLHDFGLFCERPHLAEEPSSAFCGFSRDGERCARCLGRDGPDPLGDRRRNAGRLLEVARAVVFPSTYLRDAHRALFPGERLEVVIEPAAPRAGGRPEIRPRAPRHVAFVGRLAPHKGSRVFAAVCASLAGIARFTAIGSGERPSGLPARAYGFYRPGSLPTLLARLRVDLALLPSIVPEAFGLTLSECWAAGVPALAFDHGALAERIRRHGGGRVVPLGSGGEGLSREIGGLLEGRGLGELAFHDPPRLPSGEDVARAHDALHERLGLV